VESAGLVFVGPPASAIRAMGDKTEARRRMQDAGVPIVPGASAQSEDLKAAGRAADKIGYPVMVKAAAGGGGKGMRVVREAAALANALEGARSEALKAFGDATVYLERFIERPRHVEIQILADRERTIHLGERECSVQRRHQKLLEEAPSIAVSPGLRERMGAAAVAAAKAVGYRSAGTCEFLLLPDGSFYFLEMNTRIQVEHPVTELVYGVDLVREQLRIARGELMQVAEGALSPRGWAMECRITSEDSANGFLPSTGTIEYLKPPAGPGVRWDSGIEIGDEVTLYYDSMLAKLIVWAPDRLQVLARMSRALNELVIMGVATTQGFHRRLVADAFGHVHRLRNAGRSADSFEHRHDYRLGLGRWLVRCDGYRYRVRQSVENLYQRQRRRWLSCRRLRDRAWWRWGWDRVGYFCRAIGEASARESPGALRLRDAHAGTDSDPAWAAR